MSKLPKVPKIDVFCRFYKMILISRMIGRAGSTFDVGRSPFDFLFFYYVTIFSAIFSNSAVNYQKEGPHQSISKDLCLRIALISSHHSNLFEIVAADLKKVGCPAFQVSFLIKSDWKT
jgi:hypothetical protein